MRLEALRGRLARLARESIPTHSRLPANFVDPISAMLRARIARGEPAGPAPSPEVRAEAEARLRGWFARAQVRA